MQRDLGFLERVYTSLTGMPLDSQINMWDRILAYGTFKGRAKDAEDFRRRWGKPSYPLQGYLDLTPYGLGAYLSWERTKKDANFKRHLLEYLTYSSQCGAGVMRLLYHLSVTGEEIFRFPESNPYKVKASELCDTGLVARSLRFNVMVWDPTLKRALSSSDPEKMIWMYATKLCGERIRSALEPTPK